MKKHKMDRINEMIEDDLKTYVKQASIKAPARDLTRCHYNQGGVSGCTKSALQYVFTKSAHKLSVLRKVTYALKCKNGGFIMKRHKNIKDFPTILLNKVCYDVLSEPQLIPGTTEQ